MKNRPTENGNYSDSLFLRCAVAKVHAALIKRRVGSVEM